MAVSRSFPLIDSLLGNGVPSETAKIPTTFFEETLTEAYGFRRIAGVDEAGRGPLAGPVVAAAVILIPGTTLEGVRDSKLLSAGMREKLFEEIRACAMAVGVGIVGPEIIDALNIRQAALQAMKRAVQDLPELPDFCIVDGVDEIPINIPQGPVVKGDRRCLSVAAASIIAKVTRDRIMLNYHGQYPAYGFDRNKGYGTKLHREALKRVGPSPVHRKTFRGVLL